MNNKERLVKVLIAQFLIAIIGIMIIGHFRILWAQNWNDPDFIKSITYPVSDFTAPIVSPDPLDASMPQEVSPDPLDAFIPQNPMTYESTWLFDEYRGDPHPWYSLAYESTTWHLGEQDDLHSLSPLAYGSTLLSVAHGDPSPWISQVYKPPVYPLVPPVFPVVYYDIRPWLPLACENPLLPKVPDSLGLWSPLVYESTWLSVTGIASSPLLTLPIGPTSSEILVSPEFMFPQNSPDPLPPIL